MVAAALDPHAELAEQRDLVVDIADLWDVMQHDRLVGEQCGGEQGQRGVLVARGRDTAVEPSAALDDEAFHLTS